jgi:hypothetical protein
MFGEVIDLPFDELATATRKSAAAVRPYRATGRGRAQRLEQGHRANAGIPAPPCSLPTNMDSCGHGPATTTTRPMASPPRTPAHKLPAADGCLVRERVSRFPFAQLAATVGYEIPG